MRLFLSHFGLFQFTLSGASGSRGASAARAVLEEGHTATARVTIPSQETGVTRAQGPMLRLRFVIQTRVLVRQSVHHLIRALLLCRMNDISLYCLIDL